MSDVDETPVSPFLRDNEKLVVDRFMRLRHDLMELKFHDDATELAAQLTIAAGLMDVSGLLDDVIIKYDLRA